MCFDFTARPPLPPVAGGAYGVERLILESADGTEFLAYWAGAGIPGSPAIVVLPDVRGLHPFYEELAERFAGQGFDAVAIDYFGRTAGTAPRAAEFEWRPHVEQTSAAGVAADTAAAVAYLRHGDGNEDRPVFTVGFCFGGSGSWLQAAAGHGLAGAIGFYGRPVGARASHPAPIEVVGDMTAPILGLMGGDDPGIPQSDVDAFEAALAAAGVEHELHSYPGAPHSFFDRHQEHYAADSEDAWRRMLAFIGSHS